MKNGRGGVKKKGQVQNGKKEECKKRNLDRVGFWSVKEAVWKRTNNKKLGAGASPSSSILNFGDRKPTFNQSKDRKIIKENFERLGLPFWENIK